MAENLLDNAKARQANIILPTGKAADDARVLWQMLLTQGLSKKLSRFFDYKISQFRKQERKNGAAERRDKMSGIEEGVETLIRIFLKSTRDLGDDYEKELEKEVNKQNERHRDKNLPEYIGSPLNQGYSGYYPNSNFGLNGYYSTKDIMKDFNDEKVDPYTFDFLGNTALADAPDYDPSFLFKTAEGDRYSPAESGLIIEEADRLLRALDFPSAYAAIERYLNDPNYKDYDWAGHYMSATSFLDENRGAIPFFKRRLAQAYNKAYNERIRRIMPIAEEKSLGVMMDPVMALEGPFKYIAPEIANGLVSGELYKDEFDESPIAEYYDNFPLSARAIARNPFTELDKWTVTELINPNVGEND